MVHDGTWRKSSRSGSEGNCIEVADFVDAVGVRDTKDREGPALSFDPTAWIRFIGEIRCGRLNERP
ncbi:DUF397 domain-containing protein [Micromonospora chalcea]